MFSFGLLLPKLAAEVNPGEILVAEMNCVACHAVSAVLAARLFSREAPKLAKDGVRVRPEWIREFLADPQKTKPGTLMPDMLHGIPDGQKAVVVEALTNFLVSIQPGAARLVGGAGGATIDAGRTLYHQAGCVQCHAPEVLPAGRGKDEAALAELAALQERSVPMGDLARKYSSTELAAFLRDPLKSRPSGRMPSMRLTEQESMAMAAYLLRDQEVETEFALDREKARAGAKWFISLRCAECHSDAAADIAAETRPTPVRPFDQLRARQPAGCLSSKPKEGVPKFDLTDRQRTVILVTLQSQDTLKLPLTGELQLRRTMTALNCYACHSRDRRGGAEGLRREYFTTLGGADLGEEGRIPPTLTGIGTRLDPARLRDSLFTGTGTRPFMGTRMPVYGEEKVKHLLPLLGAVPK